MMFIPMQISMFFPKIKEEFRKIIDGGIVDGLVVTVKSDGVLFQYREGVEMFLSPEMELDEIKELFEAKSAEFKEVGSNGE